MKIEKFNKINENFESETYYELWFCDKNGDDQEFYGEDYQNVDPFDLEGMVKYFMKLEEKLQVNFKHEDVFIKKIEANRLSDKVINKVKLEIEAKKYNL